MKFVYLLLGRIDFHLKGSHCLMIAFLLFVLCAEAVRMPFSKGKLSLPGAPPSNFSSFSGYATVNASAGSNLFYMLFESQNNPAKDPVVLWLTGGPGCSSELAALFENGPYTVAPGGQTLIPNPYSWNNRASILFVDSPVGTGFSYLQNPAGYATSEKQVADDLFNLLQNFFINFPELNQGQEFFVFGESYAGHYVPAISERILVGNKKRSGVHINMQGLAIGNGMTFPKKQYAEYASFSFSHGLISREVKAQLESVYTQCKAQLDAGNPNASNTCNTILDTVQTVGSNFNVYNMQESCLGNLCYAGLADVSTYLNRADVLAALGVNTQYVSNWTSCDGLVYADIANNDWFNQEEYVVPFLLDSYRVLIYNGMNDWICNHQGNYKWVSEMASNLQAGFNAAPRLAWISNTTQGVLVKGYEQQYKNLQFVWVVGGGHMVPHDKPAEALELFNSFIYSQPLPVQQPQQFVRHQQKKK